MKFDASGKRITVAPTTTTDSREAAYWYEREKVDAYGFCAEPIPCTDGFDITHLCGRFRGHGGKCAAVVRAESGGRVVRRLEYA